MEYGVIFLVDVCWVFLGFFVWYYIDIVGIFLNYFLKFWNIYYDLLIDIKIIFVVLLWFVWNWSKRYFFLRGKRVGKD